MIDRSIYLRMERRTPGESVAKLRDAPLEVFERLRRQAARWALDNGARVQQARPAVPEALNDRAGDNWHPLLQIAAVAGIEPSVVTSAALALSADQGDDNIQVRLLTALRTIFTPDVDFLQTEDIIGTLNKDLEAPWADWKNKMTPEKLGRILKEYRVKPEQRRKGPGIRHRGYSRNGLLPVFDRYLGPDPPPPLENGPEPVPSPVDQVLEPTGVAQVERHNPCPAQVEKDNPCHADQVPEPIGEEWHRLEPKKEGKGADEGVRKVQETSDELPGLSVEKEEGNAKEGVLDRDTAKKGEPQLDPDLAKAAELAKKIFRATPCTEAEDQSNPADATDSSSSCRKSSQAVVPPAPKGLTRTSNGCCQC